MNVIYPDLNSLPLQMKEGVGVLTAIWQATDFREYDWICELFGEHITEHIYDGSRETVMDNCIVFDKFIDRHPEEYYAAFAAKKNVFLFHMSDEQYNGGYEYYRYFDGVFRNYYSSIFSRSVVTIPLGYSNGTASRGPAHLASTRRYKWSFVGETGRASRPEMIKALLPITEQFCHSTDSGAGVLSPSTYRDVLESSVFAPCPMGRVNLECFRLYEALECGTIPILERRPLLNYFTELLGPHPLIMVNRWAHAAELIGKLSQDPTQVDQLQTDIGAWWASKKLELQHEISKVLSLEKGAKPKRLSYTKPQYHLPLWQVAELSRHQSMMAFGRRLEIQWRRATRKFIT